MNNVVQKFKESPRIIKDFIFSDDFLSSSDELVKKFELNDEQELDLIYLLQDLAVKFLEPADVFELTYLIKQKNITKEENAGQLAHFIWTRFKPLVDKIWQEAKSMEKEIKTSKEEAFKDIIQKIKTQPISKNVVNLAKVAQTPDRRIELKSPISNLKMKNQNEKITKIETEPVPPSAVVIPQIQKGGEPLKAKIINTEPEIETNQATHTQPIPETELPSGQEDKKQEPDNASEQAETIKPSEITQQQTKSGDSAIDLSNI